MTPVKLSIPHVKQMSKKTSKAVAQATLKYWREIAREEDLGTLYVKTLKVVETANGYMIKSSAPWSHAVEHGYPPFDMKKSLGRGKSDRYSKRYHVWYRIVPIRHYVRRRSQEARHWRYQMSDEIYQHVKRFGLVTGDDTKPSPVTPGLNDPAKVGIFERLQRGYTKKGGVGYYTFRTMSQRQGKKWIHPGFPGLEQLPRVKAFAQELSREVLKKH